MLDAFASLICRHNWRKSTDSQTDRQSSSRNPIKQTNCWNEGTFGFDNGHPMLPRHGVKVL